MLFRSLLNVSATHGDEGWRLAWIKSRLRYIESAENMSYHIPGFRQSHSWFPKEIYFTATSQQVEDYRESHTSSKTRHCPSATNSTSENRINDLQRWAQQAPDVLQQGDVSARELKATMANIVAALTDIQKDIQDIRHPVPVKRITKVTFDDEVQTRQLRDIWDSDYADEEDSQQDSEETIETVRGRTSPLAKAL